MTEITMQALAAIIVSICGATKENLDKNDKVLQCVDMMINCSVDKNSKMFLEKALECTKKVK
jgi:hypothetical protein